MNAIEFKGVWEKYRIKFIEKGRVSWEEMWALQDLTLSVRKGEVLGIIGPNGAGKTTLLKLISGMLVPDKGEVVVNGRISMLMELGAGFNPEFTGSENILLNAKIYGLGEEELTQRLDKIAAFAGLGKFFNAPIKYYSQGMYMRLAFALAIYVEPDILLIDDILAVGDEEAHQKCINKIFELKEAGKTIVVVSHEMGMMERLCDNLALLEKGKIIQHGNSKKVINRYLESVGDRKGIAVLSQERLRVTFNNGRLMLDYNDTAITKGVGGFFSFYMPNSNHPLSSFNLVWRIDNHNEKEVIAEGLSQKGILVQRWRLRMDGARLKLDIDMGDEAVKEPRIDVMLISDYKEWINIKKAEEFPDFIHKTNWQDMGPDIAPGGILGLAPQAASGLPSLIFRLEKSENSSIELLNTGYEQESRVIRINLPENNNSLEILVCPSKVEFADYISNFRQKLIVKYLENQERVLPMQTISNGQLSLVADSQGRVLRLYFKDREITGEGGGVTTVLPMKAVFSVDVQKISQNKLIVDLCYKDPFLLSQIWTFVCSADNTLDIKVECELKKDIVMPNRDLRLSLSCLYKNWKTAYEEGDFSSGQYVNDISPVRLKYNKVSGVALTHAAGGLVPALRFRTSDKSRKCILGIYKYKESGQEAICLNYGPIVSKKEEIVQKGRYIYFDGSITLDDNVRLEDEPYSENSISLAQKDSKFIFDDGKGRIFKDGKELTSGLGFYTSMRYAGIWYDSSLADWKVTYQKEDTIIANGDWPYIPISQTWRIGFIAEDLIQWKIEMEVFEEVSLEIQQANLMLDSKYRSWKVPGIIEGNFLDEYTADYDIFPFRFWYGCLDGEGLGAISENLPAVFFSCNKKDGDCRGIVENSDHLYKGRLLQYQKSFSKIIPPGTYDYFEGIIKVKDSQGALPY